MAIGEKAAAAGYPLVPNSGANGGKVSDGPQEINRTRDFIADILTATAKTPAEFRTSAGITSGTANPSGGSDGDIYFKII